MLTRLKSILADTFVRFTGYAYSNLGRLFMRLFVGVMFIQFGIRQLVNYHTEVTTFPSILGMSSECGLIVLITIELVCSILIMAGFLTRLATIPPIIAMAVAEWHILYNLLPDKSIYSITSTQPGYVPVMFIGIFLFIILAGPGKVSLDYFISLFIINRRGKNEEEELEDV